MALFLAKREMVNKILSENIHNNIKHDLKQRVMDLIEPEIEAIVNEAVMDLTSRIETINDLDGSLKVNVLFQKGAE